MLAKNIDRRHLTPGQRALVAARLKPLFEEEARQRQRAPLKQGTQFPVGENSPQREKGRSAQQAAELMKISDFSVKAADRVKKQGVPQLVDALAAGRVSVAQRVLPMVRPIPWQNGKLARFSIVSIHAITC